MQDDSMCIDVLNARGRLWRCSGAGVSVDVAPPVFEIEGREVVGLAERFNLQGPPRVLTNGVTERVWSGRLRDDSAVALDLVVRVAPDNPVIRFQYRLRADQPRRLTKSAGSDRLTLGGISLQGLPDRKEVRFSEFDESVHSFRLVEHPLPARAFEDGLDAMGPMLVAAGQGRSILVAYEHGSQVPDAFLTWGLGPDETVTLRAVKGSYAAGTNLAQTPCESVWMQVAAVAGDEDVLARVYRDFVLRHMSQNVASRTPYIYYNTWAYQERNKWWGGKRYLDSMVQERILAEIDVAHRMGIDVFVLDTGWYERTGDWRVNRQRFPDGLKTVRERLDRYGMKLGLWFSPTQAAVSSRILREHEDCRMARDGALSGPFEVWETESSYNMCLVTRYWEAFADEMIRLVREVGVTYFKWDAVGQYGCNAPGHWHGTEANTPQERADCYAFALGRYMARVVDRLCAACPEAIVDFDITEGGRYVGLGFLSAGKYFLINNGPYFGSLDNPYDWAKATVWSNVFVYPGPARARVCRAPLDFDKWIPSVLFLTHYLPDDPESSQMINLASLVLGQNGIWGDLLTVSENGVGLFGKVLGLYKQVREDITAASPVCTGIVGGSPEVHEKINPVTGRGAVAVFAGAAGRYAYVSASPVAAGHWASECVSVSLDLQGRARIECEFKQPGAHLVFFGVKPTALGR